MVLVVYTLLYLPDAPATRAGIISYCDCNHTPRFFLGDSKYTLYHVI